MTTKKEGIKKVEENPMKKTMSDKTRYFLMGGIAIVLLALIIVLAVVGNKSNVKTSVGGGIAVEDRNLSTPALKEFYQEFDSKELNVIFFARTSCGYCALQKPILEQIIEDYDMPCYKIDTDELESSEVQEIINALSIEGSTPATVVVQNGKVVDSNTGYLDGKDYVAFLKKNGMLPEDAIYKPEEKLVDITYDDFKKIAEKDKASLVLLDQSACQNCITARSVLNDLAEKNDFTINYLSASNLSQDEITSVASTDLKKMGYDEESYVDDGTVNIPLLLVLKNNKVVDYVLQGTEESDYTKVLKKHGFID